jgi:hypothetical protein
MLRFDPSAEGAREWPAPEAEPDEARCPRCGSGDLLVTRVLRGLAVPVVVSYCVGIFDRGRRRFVRRSCGYSTSGSGASPGA